jgi:hypothetical protein
MQRELDAKLFAGRDWSAMRHKKRISSEYMGVVLASIALLLSIILYFVFVIRYLSNHGGIVTRLAALHVPLAGLAALISLYTAVRHRSLMAAGLLVASLAVAVLYFFFTMS